MMDYALFVRNFFILVALNSLGVLETSDRCLRSFGACWRGVFSQEVFKSARLKEWGPLGPKRQRQWCRKHLEVAIKLCESTTKEKKRRKLSARGWSGNTCWTTWEWSRVDRRWVSWPYHVDFLLRFSKKKKNFNRCQLWKGHEKFPVLFYIDVVQFFYCCKSSWPDSFFCKPIERNENTVTELDDCRAASLFTVRKLSF